MTLEEITAEMTKRVGEDCGLGKIVKFNFGNDGVVRVDAISKPNIVSNEDIDADCTVTLPKALFEEISDGKQNPQMAFMMGKMKVQGDMGIALKLGTLLR
jgi:putative sterol carrier protein